MLEHCLSLCPEFWLRDDAVLVGVEVGYGEVDIAAVDVAVGVGVEELEYVGEGYHFEIFQLLDYLGAPGPTNDIFVALEPGTHLQPVNNGVFVKIHLPVKVFEFLHAQLFVAVCVQDAPEVFKLFAGRIRTFHETFLIEGGPLHTQRHEHLFS